MEQLQSWLEQHKDFPLSVWSRSSAGIERDYGIYPPGQCDRAWGEIRDFKDCDDSCEFYEKQELFILTVEELPSDRWGNTATFFGGLTLEGGCFEVAYYDRHKIPTIKFNFPYDIEDSRDFLNWLRYTKPHLIGEVTEIKKSQDGRLFYSDWAYFTTNHPFDGEEWLGAIAAYRAESK